MLLEQKTEKEHRLPLMSDPTVRSLTFYMNTVCECCLAAYCSCLGGTHREGLGSSDLNKLTAGASVTSYAGSRNCFLGGEDSSQSVSQHHENSLQVGFQKHWKMWNKASLGCMVHSRCSFCNRPLFQSGQHERSVKRKFAKVYVQEQLEERQCSALQDAGDVDQDGMKSPKKHKDVLVGSGRAERMEVCENEELRQFKEALQAERDTVNALYMELEQERNAAAVAATETLAMITRLQEEKAAVQMEARQYKRMVEERSVYDEEAIDMLNEILAKQEEEKNALEKEVEMYKGTQVGKKRLLNGEDENLRLLEDSGGSRLSACGDSKSDYMTPFGSDNGTVAGCSNTVYQTRNLLESFYSVGEGCNGRSNTEHASARFERARPDSTNYRRCKMSTQKCAQMDYAPGSANSRGSPSRVTRDRMDIDDAREDSGASGVHDIYEVPRQNYGASSGGREENEYGVGWRSDEYQARRQTISPVSRTPQRGHDRLGKPDAMPGNSGMYSNSMIQPTSRGEARAGSLVQRNGDLSAELRQLSLRLQALEADREFMDHNLGSRKNGNDDMQILEEISQQLQHFQALDRTQDDMKELLQPEASFVFSFKGFFSFNGLRQSLHSHINRLACMFLKHTDAGLSYGDHVGLSHLLESSRKARAVPCITRGIKVDAPPFASNATPSYMLPRQNVNWPMDARGRSETAFSGWDY